MMESKNAEDLSLVNVDKSFLWSSDHDGKLAEFRKDWIAKRSIIETRDFHALKVAVEDIYEGVGLGRPRVIRCANPWDLILYPTLLTLLAQIGFEMREELFSSNWDRRWKASIARLDAQLDESFVAELIKRSRDGESGLRVDCLYQGEWRGLGRMLLPDHKQSGLFQRIKNVLSADVFRRLGAANFSLMKRQLAGRVASYAAISQLIATMLFACVAPSDVSMLYRYRPVKHDQGDNIAIGQTDLEFTAQLTDALASKFNAFLADSKAYGQFQEDSLAKWFSIIWTAAINAVSWFDRGFDFLPVALFASRSLGLLEPRQERLIDSWATVATAQNLCVFFSKVAFICDPPGTISLNQENRLHNEFGPALAYGDAQSEDEFRLYVWNGVIVPAIVVEAPGRITVEMIEREPNLEIRRVLIERYGMSRYLIDAKAQRIHEDEYGVLYYKEVPEDEPIVMVEVKDATSLPDGSRRAYFLRVPSYVRTAREAVAWTFNLSECEYDPQIET